MNSKSIIRDLCLLLALALVLTAVAMLTVRPANAATWPSFAGNVDLKTIRYDTSGRDQSGRLAINFTSSSDSVYWIGVPTAVISVQSVSAAVTVMGLGDPDCFVADSRSFYTLSASRKTVANPRAGRPCVDTGWIPVTTAGYDIPRGAIAVRVKGSGLAGTAELVWATR